MKECTYGATPWSLLNRPIGLLALHGRDGEDDGAKPDADTDKNEDKSKDGAKPDGDNEDKDEDKGKGDGETVETLTRKLANAKDIADRAVDKRDEYKAQLAEANAKITKMEKDGSPDKAIKEENETLKTQVGTLTSTNQRLMLEIALRDDKHYDWVNPDAVLKLADLSEVDFDAKTLKPRGLKAALDKLAKESPFLLKPKAPADDDGKGKPAPRGTGRPPAPKGNTQDAAAVAEAQVLKAKYPALRRG